ncbi:hypothetical protein MW887_010402 [Aspergillus wentii]|nr:hypothetical protein MW887_010402 [Aspergillus wentii]
MGQTIRLADLDHSCIAVAKARKIADQGQGVFDEIEHMLDMLKSTDSHESLRTIPLSHRVKWSFRKHHITYLLAHLEYLKLSLIVLQKIVHIEMLIKTMSSFDLEKDETIAQEKAETQNMIIVRYWSGNRLSRLWEFAEQEAFEAANDQTNQLITSHYSTLRTSPSDSHGAKLTKYPDFSLNDTNMDLSAMEISSKDMVQLSEKTVEVLLSTLFPTSGHSTSRSVQNQGYPLESTTIDWRKPRSQEARQHAAQLWERHSKYQAHVESDPEEKANEKVRVEVEIQSILDRHETLRGGKWITTQPHCKVRAYLRHLISHLHPIIPGEDIRHIQGMIVTNHMRNLQREPLQGLQFTSWNQTTLHPVQHHTDPEAAQRIIITGLSHVVPPKACSESALLLDSWRH